MRSSLLLLPSLGLGTNLTLLPAPGCLALAAPSAPFVPRPRGGARGARGTLVLGAGVGLGGGRSQGAILLPMVRGGGEVSEDIDEDSDEDSDEDTDEDTDDESAESYEDESSADEEAALEASDDAASDDAGVDDAEARLAPSDDDLERTTNAAQLSSRSRNFGIATALWASLAFDCILNGAKRSTLFPSSAAAGLNMANAGATAKLISGFGLASGAAFLLWRDMEIRADILASGDGESGKGDRFLALAASDESEDDEEEGKFEEFASRTRGGLLLHLALFGFLSLGAHVGYLVSDEAPFLGTSAAVVNVHNVLACVGALGKEGDLKDRIVRTLSRPLGILRGDVGKAGRGTTPSVFRAFALASYLQCVPSIVRIARTASALLGSAKGTSIIVDDARRLSLEVASLARLALFAGVSGVLSTASGDGGRGRHPFFVALGEMLSLSCLTLGAATFLDVWGGVANVRYAVVGTLLASFGAFAGYVAASGFVSGRGKGGYA